MCLFSVRYKIVSSLVRTKYFSGPVACLDQLVYWQKVCARATSDLAIGRLVLAVDWTEKVTLDQLLSQEF